MEKKCCYCGVSLNKVTETKDHIPAKNLYEGLAEEYKNNLITVKCCNNCNNKYSRIDSTLRDVIGALYENQPNIKPLAEKTIKSITRNKNWVTRVTFDKLMKKARIKFNSEDLRLIQEKHFKALFCRHFNVPTFPSNFLIKVFMCADTDLKEALRFAELVDSIMIQLNIDWEISGHEDIFKYRIVDIQSDDKNIMSKPSKNVQTARYFMASFIYHKEFDAYIVAGKREVMDQLEH